MTTSSIDDAYQAALVQWLHAAGAEAKRRPGDRLVETKLRSSSTLPLVRATLEAARRYQGHESSIAMLLLSGMEAAARLGILVLEVVLTARVPYEEDEIADGIHIDFGVGPIPQRAALWDRLAEIDSALPFEVWFTLS